MGFRRYHSALGLGACLLALATCITAAPGIAAQAAQTQLAITAPIPQNLRFCLGEQTCEVGDVDGDRQADLIVFVRNTRGRARSGEVWVALHTTAGFAEPIPWHTSFCQGNEDCTVGDVDADGRADLVAFIKDTRGDDQLGQVLIARSTGIEFDGPASAQISGSSPQRLVFCIGSEICRTGDINGDGRDDLIAFTRSAYPNRPGYVWYAQHIAPQDNPPPSIDSAFAFIEPVVIKTDFCKSEAECTLGDVDADGTAEPIAFLRQTSPGNASNHVQVYVPGNLAVTDSGRVETWHKAFCLLNERCMVGDLDGSLPYVPNRKQVDLVAFSSQLAGDGTISYSMKIALASGRSFVDPPLELQGDYCPGNDICRLADIDGNGQDDVVAFDRSASTRECASNLRVSFAWNKLISPPHQRPYNRPRPTQAGGGLAAQVVYHSFLPMASGTMPVQVYCPS